MSVCRIVKNPLSIDRVVNSCSHLLPPSSPCSSTCSSSPLLSSPLPSFLSLLLLSSTVYIDSFLPGKGKDDTTFSLHRHHHHDTMTFPLRPLSVMRRAIRYTWPWAGSENPRDKDNSGREMTLHLPTGRFCDSRFVDMYRGVNKGLYGVA